MTEVKGVLVLDDKTFFIGKMPFEGKASGEICFNTGMTGYQESITDPSYTGQIINFTFPYVGNNGFNGEDFENRGANGARGIIVRNEITTDSNFRSEGNFVEFAKASKLAVITGIDTRLITNKIRSKSVSNCIISSIKSEAEIPALLEEVMKIPSMDGMDLTQIASTGESYVYSEGNVGSKTVVAIDYGIKENILRILSGYGLKVVVVPFNASFEEVMKFQPNGVFLSNGPGDPRETIKHTGETIKKLATIKMPIFGICLGHQILCGIFGGKLIKLPQGHRGINHPVINLDTGIIEITPQNHGFACSEEQIPEHIKITHQSLFDDVIEGIEIEEGAKVNFSDGIIEVGKIFAVQYHPEGNAGPNDSKYLFDKFFHILK
jgi:carbamoyl-phosphate synthase small subunit